MEWGTGRHSNETTQPSRTPWNMYIWHPHICDYTYPLRQRTGKKYFKELMELSQSGGIVAFYLFVFSVLFRFSVLGMCSLSNYRHMNCCVCAHQRVCMQALKWCAHCNTALPGARAPICCHAHLCLLCCELLWVKEGVEWGPGVEVEVRMRGLWGRKGCRAERHGVCTSVASFTVLPWAGNYEARTQQKVESYFPWQRSFALRL